MNSPWKFFGICFSAGALGAGAYLYVASARVDRAHQIIELSGIKSAAELLFEQSRYSIDTLPYAVSDSAKISAAKVLFATSNPITQVRAMGEVLAADTKLLETCEVSRVALVEYADTLVAVVDGKRPSPPSGLALAADQVKSLASLTTDFRTKPQFTVLRRASTALKAEQIEHLEKTSTAGMSALTFNRFANLTKPPQSSANAGPSQHCMTGLLVLMETKLRAALAESLNQLALLEKSEK